jgi:hypothetical protein
LVGFLKDLSSEIRQGEVQVAGAQVDPYYLAEAGVDPDHRASLAEDQEPLLDQRAELAWQGPRLNAKLPAKPAHRNRLVVRDFPKKSLLSAFRFDRWELSDCEYPPTFRRWSQGVAKLRNSQLFSPPRHTDTAPLLAATVSRFPAATKTDAGS